jgi:plastocyanin
MAGKGTSRPIRTGIRSRRAIAFAAVALALSLAGIQGAVASPGREAQASRAAGVGIDHFAFHPPTLRVAKGTTVSFHNSSRTAHTATDKGSFDTGRIAPGKSVAVRFSRKGTFAYHCTIHPFMHGKIVVE